MRSRVRIVLFVLLVIAVLSYLLVSKFRQPASKNAEHVPRAAAGEHDFGIASELMQDHIQAIQHPQDCNSSATLECGRFSDYCGFGCQLHIQTACLMISVALRMPLIHNQDTWSYAAPWDEMLQPLGSSCRPGPNTVTLDWRANGREPHIYQKYCKSYTCKRGLFTNPLNSGVPLPAELADKVSGAHPNPWLWAIGQYIKYAFRLQPEIAARIERDKKDIGFPVEGPTRARTVVGIQIRRTDKVRDEDPDLFHPVEKYFEEAASFFRHGHAHATYEYKAPRTVFIATDDRMTLEEAKMGYGNRAEWKVLSFPPSPSITHFDMATRRDELYSIIRDIVVLGDCEYAVCGFSSNVCTLVLEIFSQRWPDATSRVRSLDTEYNFMTAAKGMPQKIVKC